MHAATVMLWRKTPISMQILKTLVICSLLEDCFTPKGSKLDCIMDVYFFKQISLFVKNILEVTERHICQLP